MNLGEQPACTVYLGGTFNPPHNGHLRLMIHALENLGASQGVFIPCHITPHKTQPVTSSVHRLGMLQAMLGSRILATDLLSAGLTLATNDYELSHDRPSYTIHTLKHLRQKMGKQHAIVWVLGVDSLATLDTWRDWRQLTQWCHLVVLARPGWDMPTRGDMADWWRDQQMPLKQLREQPCGGCAVLNGEEMNIASSTLRRQIINRQSIAGLVPESVLQYIQQHKIYTN